MTLDRVSPLKKTNHCAALDGVRGLSALFVLLFHVGHWLDVPGLAVNGGLAVDTFFTLSGYVLARAYLDRVDILSNKDFLLQRLVRLMPIIALSLFMSAPYVVLRDHLTLGNGYISEVMLALALGLLNLPYFHAPSQIGGPQVFPLNGPQFSLFFELVVNVFWWSIRHAPQFYTSLFLYIVSSVLVLTMGIGGDRTDNFGLGFYHVGSSFFIGVFCYCLITRLAKPIKVAWLFYLLLGVMLVIFSMPYELDFQGRMLWKLVLAPLLIVTGSTVTLSVTAERLSTVAGDLSFPIYALHYPIFCWVNGVIQRLAGGKAVALEAVCFILATFAISALALHLYDQPVRARLGSLLKRSRERSAPRASGSTL